MLWALRLQAHEQVTTGPCDRNRNPLSQHSARYDKHEGDPPVMSPAVPTGSLTRLYRNAGADVAMQRCEESRKASVMDCTTAPLVSARAPLHTLLRQSHWLLERRMPIVSESDTPHNSYADMGTEFDIHYLRYSGKAPVMGARFRCWALRPPWATDADGTHTEQGELLQRSIASFRHSKLLLGHWRCTTSMHNPASARICVSTV